MTNKTKHTPGPWNVGKHYTSDQDVGLYDSVVHSLAGYQVANVTDGLVVGNEEAKANGRLIAASPDMLQALESILEIEALRTKDCNVGNVGALTELLRDIAGTARTAIDKVAA